MLGDFANSFRTLRLTSISHDWSLAEANISGQQEAGILNFGGLGSIPVGCGWPREADDLSCLPTQGS